MMSEGHQRQRFVLPGRLRSGVGLAFFDGMFESFGGQIDFGIQRLTTVIRSGERKRGEIQFIHGHGREK